MKKKTVITKEPGTENSEKKTLGSESELTCEYESRKQLTIDERMLILKEDAERLAIEYNSAVSTDKSLTEVKEIETKLDQTVSDYTNEATKKCFDEIKSTENPMLEAAKRLTYQVIRYKDEKKKDSPTVRIIEYTDKEIDPLKLQQAIGSIGFDKNWQYMIEKFNFLLTARVATEISDAGAENKTNVEKMLKEINDSYAMSKIARDIVIGKSVASNTNCLATLNKIVTAMLGGEYKALTHDIKYLLLVYSKKGRKALSVNCSNHKYLRSYIMQILHRIVTKGFYNVEYKSLKNS